MEKMKNNQWVWLKFNSPSVIVLTLFLLCVTSVNSTQLRHVRQLDWRYSNDFTNPQGKNHNHKPIFSNCSNYAPVIKEEEPPGTIVIQVTARDNDPPEEGGTITYSFVTMSGEKVKFEINNRTGLIRTTQSLDRDEPEREKEVYLTVLATDNGKPQLDDICTFKVTVEDVNDNPPVFDKVEYTEFVPQDLPLGSEVMRVSATDRDDGNNSVVRYSLKFKKSDDIESYFRIDTNTGVIFLNRTIDKNPDYRFIMEATAMDQGKPPRYSTIDLDIRVIESHKKAPSFDYRSLEPIRLPENFSDFDSSIVTLTATSNIDDSPTLLFDLIPKGKTRNKQSTFRLETANNTAFIKLAQHLDYETTTKYTLIVTVQNKHNLTAETTVTIEVLDVNDNIPVFQELEKGSVLENEPPGVPVMQVRATDADGTSANNQVTYELDNFQDLFAIDRNTGNITTLKTFDREEEDTYNVKVIATDNSPSALFKTGKHNQGQQVFRIEIADKNDNSPSFNQSVYVANAIPENANINEMVIEVKAVDADTDIASPVVYSIISGNLNNSFFIEKTTGEIRVKQPLDYETVTEYTLTVKAFDGLFYDTAQVKIFIEDVNDNPPVFGNFDTNPVIEEEKLIKECITTVVAYDPDIKDRNAYQNITYSIRKETQKPLIEIDNSGCLRLKKPLDRDAPNGYPTWQIAIAARDQNGLQDSLPAYVTVNITLEDINDNAPFLDMPYPVIWDENKAPGRIITLEAQDYDDPKKNGPPFYFEIAYTADEEIKSKFSIRDGELYALVQFDREEKKSYIIPISISDSGSPTMTGTSMLTVIIGDKNDNPMKSGVSSIFVYNYKGEAPDSEIGRVYVDDPDDWDLPDKKFSWASSHDGFQLNPETGMITLLSGVTNKSMTLKFRVKEQSNYFPSGPAEITVEAIVNVTIKEIPEEAVVKSGSVRFYGISAEEFVMPIDSELSRKDMLQDLLANILNVSTENVDVFTVLHSPHHNNKSLLDVRFSAHGSPYYAPEKLNTILSKHVNVIEQKLETDILLINIDECLQEKLHCNNSCRSYLNVSTVPSTVFTNTTSFVGVRAVVDPQCICHVAEPIVCLNGGTPVGEKCKCPPGYDGQRCELLAIGFHGDGWAIMPPPGQACDDSHLGLEITSHAENGLIFYFGPMNYFSKLGIQDFMALEIQDGSAVLYVDYGTGTIRLDQKQIKLTDGKNHRIDIYLTKNSIEMKIDNCRISACMRLTAPQGPNEFLNVNGPMQVGGTLSNLAHLSHKFGWNFTPTEKGFVGCIRNMTFNGNTYNLGVPSMSKNADYGCNHGVAKAVSFGINRHFFVAIAVCVVTLLILLLAVVVHKKRTDDLYKDMDDIRENIINYDDEGGGEVDTGYDLNVLRATYDPSLDSKLTPIGLQFRGQTEVPDICGFLDVRKESCDTDPDTNPFDDVRHYAYEGEGNSDGSLSSLASCTDDGDLKFNYLSNFGPRFRKLADMYGEEPSDEESEGVCERESESWC